MALMVGRGMVLAGCVAVAVTVAVVVSLVASSPAFATTGYAFADEFGGAGNGPGEFTAGGPTGIEIDQPTGDVFASDPGHTLDDGITPDPRIERFDASGVFESAFSIVAGYSSPGALAVDPDGSGSVYVSATDVSSGEGAVLKYSAAGVFAYALDTAGSGVVVNVGAGVAVDPVSGNVFVTATDLGSEGRQVVAVFDSMGMLIRSFDGSSSPEAGFACPSSLAVDGASRLYVVDTCRGRGRVDRYSTTGVFGGVVDDGGRGAPVGVTVDPVSNEVFVLEDGSAGPQVTQFTAAGAAVGQSFGPPQMASLAGVAVNHSLGVVYVADVAKAVVERFVPFEGPTVATTTGVSIDAHSETLNGTIDSGGVASTYHFEYGTTTVYGSRTAESDPIVGSGPVPVAATVTGLDPNTTYHFRIVGTSASGSITGNDRTFTTLPAPPLVDGSPAFVSSITPSGATLHATLNPNGSDTAFRFEFGTSGSCDANPCASTAAVGAGGGHGDQPVTADLAGLTAGATYHYRLVADNGTGGVQHGADGTFSTAPATPVSASNVGVIGADLHGVINPHGAPTSYHFEYGPTIAYGRSTPETDGGSSDGDKAVSQPSGRLSPGTTYHFRVVATSNGQTTSSDDATFTTAMVPAAALSYPTGISTSEATLAGTVDTHGSVGSYTFHVESLDGSYSTTTTPQPAPAGAGPSPVTARLAGLPAGETFGVVLSIATNKATANASTVFSTLTATKRPNRPIPKARCTNPILDRYDRRPHPGETITLTGQDLGAGGTATLAGKPVSPRHWTTSRISVRIPQRATGTRALTINCGKRSNPIAITISPTNKFTITNTKTNTRTATLRLKLPGAGKIRITGRHTNPNTTKIAKAGPATIKIKLTNTLANTRKLKTTIHVRYTPNHGQPNTKTRTLTFRPTSPSSPRRRGP